MRSNGCRASSLRSPEGALLICLRGFLVDGAEFGKQSFERVEVSVELRPVGEVGAQWFRHGQEHFADVRRGNPAVERDERALIDAEADAVEGVEPGLNLGREGAGRCGGVGRDVEPAGDQAACEADFAERRVAAVVPVIVAGEVGAVIEQPGVANGGPRRGRPGCREAKCRRVRSCNRSW